MIRRHRIPREQTSALSVRKPRPRHRLGFGLLTLLAGFAGLTFSACGGSSGGATAGSAQGKPIVIFSIDTLRSDRLPAYGYKNVETPAIDALAKDGVVFERAYSQIPLTLPSHATILSGQLPGKHGVRDNLGYRFDGSKRPYLPRLLGAAGWTTGAMVSSYVLRAETGLSEGFNEYESGIDLRTSEALGRSQRPGSETVELALDWLAKAKNSGDGGSQKPPFLLIHIYEPHTPYEPIEPFRSRYRDLYDGEVATADSIFGRFVAGLRDLDLYDDTTLVLLSDHGEGLGDHGEEEHGIFLYREAIQVPLVVKLANGRKKGTRIQTPTALADVAPTVLELAGLAVPPDVDGVALPFEEPKEASRRAIYSETFYPRLHLGWNELTSAIRDRFHLIQGPDPELFDLVADGSEKNNVLRQERRTYGELRAELDKLTAPLAAPSAVDAETEQKLASLGYLGGVVAGNGPLPDPKSRIQSLAAFGEAMQNVSEQKFKDAVPKLQKLVADNPQMIDAWEGLGNALLRLGQPQEALAAYDQALKVSGGSGHVALGAASALIALGRLDEAQTYAEIGAKTSPTAGHTLLAQIAENRGDFAAAEKEARVALDARGSRIGPLVSLAELLQKQGKTEEALKLADQAEAEVAKTGQRGFEGLRALRGDLLARLGRNREAEEIFREEIKKFPAQLSAYSHLATLCASEGRVAEAVATLKQMVDANDSPAAYGEAVRTLRVLGDPRGAAALLAHARSLFPDSSELRKL